MYQRYTWICINILIITIFAFFIADITNIYFTYSLESSHITNHRESVTSPKETMKEKKDYESIIIQKNIFSTKDKGAPSDSKFHEDKITKADETKTIPLSDLKVKLVGTISGNKDVSYAIVEDIGNREQNLYKLFKLINPDTKIVNINRNVVTLLRGDHKEQLQVYIDESEKVHVASNQSATMGPVIGTGIRNVTGNKWVLDKEEVVSALGDLPQLLTKARIIPNFTGGKPDGFKIFNIIPNSFYDKIGIQNGDILQRINGIEINDPENFMKVFLQLKDENNIALDMIRNSKKESFEYEVR